MPEPQPDLLLNIEKRFDQLKRESNLLTPVNQSVLFEVFRDTVKLVYYRQKNYNRPTLKAKEIGLCLELVYFHHLRHKEVNVTGDLAENLGGTFAEDDALNYYEKKLEAVYVDKLGDPVTIDDKGIDFLYEDHKMGGRYLEPRGKRLPWIKDTLLNSREIYQSDEEGYQQYYYVTHYVIPLRHPDRSLGSYFVVIIRKRKDKSLGFLTAFPVDRYNQFLSKASRWRPVHFREGKKLA